MALVLLWSSVLCWHRSRPLPSSPGLHSGSSQRLATKNWKTEANLAENGWGWSVPAQLRPGDGKTVRYGWTSMASTRGCGYVFVTRCRETERVRYHCWLGGRPNIPSPVNTYMSFNPLVLWRCWLGERKGIPPVKKISSTPLIINGANPGSSGKCCSVSECVYKVKSGRGELLMELRLTAIRCHLPYGITQCYLPPDTSERMALC